MEMEEERVTWENYFESYSASDTVKVYGKHYLNNFNGWVWLSQAS